MVEAPLPLGLVPFEASTASLALGGLSKLILLWLGVWLWLLVERFRRACFDEFSLFKLIMLHESICYFSDFFPICGLW